MLDFAFGAADFFLLCGIPFAFCAEFLLFGVSNSFYALCGNFVCLLRGILFYPELLSAEEAVARISKTGKDISVLVQASVEGGYVDVYVGVRLGNL